MPLLVRDQLMVHHGFKFCANALLSSPELEIVWIPTTVLK